MNDLISRQAALDIIDAELNGWLTDDEKLHLEGVGTGIECLPTIDAVPVVRCKDCKWWGLSQYNTVGIHICKKFSGVRGESDFCSRAERGEE